MNSSIAVPLRGPGSPGRMWHSVVGEVVADRVDRVVFTLTAVVIGLGYSVMLPFAYTQRVSTANWRYLDARYVAFTVAFALAIAWLMALQVHGVRRLARTAARERSADSGGPLGGLAAIVSVLPSLLCCSPVLPTLVGMLGLSATSRLTTTVALQHFFATEGNLILAGTLALLLGAGAWSVRKLACAPCLDGGCCVVQGDSNADVPGQVSNCHRPAAEPVVTGTAWPQRAEGSR